MNSLIKRVLFKMTGCSKMQSLLEWNVCLSQYLMGIGAGSYPGSSGERVLVKKLRLQYAKVGRPLCIFDVGANSGQFLHFIASDLKDTPFYLHAFEPGKLAYNLLDTTCKKYSNIKINNVALGKEEGEMNLYYDRAGTEVASLYKRRLDHLGKKFVHSERVIIETLDNYCTKNSISTIDLLKLDVEGHELQVLQGGLKMLERHNIGMISFEFGGCNIDSRSYFQDFYYYFHQIGVKGIFRITPSGYLVQILQYKEIYEQFRTTNFLVIL